ncbi:MAG: hypothetical protein ACRYF5_15165 [Janthinobacterium lividum]
MIDYLTDPRAFSILIIVLFFLAAIRWAFAGNWPQTAYWLAAGVLNIAVLAMSKP